MKVRREIEVLRLTDYIFTEEELTKILESVVNRTLGEVDEKNIFRRTETHKKITGIAGDVIEQSVLNMSANSKQSPDIIVDGEEVELKTTGIRLSKKDNSKFEAKEPLTITAVTPKEITEYSFSNSHFWNKIEKLLFVYYHYKYDKPVPASQYREFMIKGFEIFEFPEEERAILENDWTLVRNFIEKLNTEHDNPEEEYHRISSELRDKLMFIDTAPKWPNPPRFRLKRAVINSIIDRYFNKKLEELDQNLTSFRDLDEKLKEYTEKYEGKTVSELVEELNITPKNNYSKSIGEQVVTSMFGSKERKISKIKLFKEIGLAVKTITQTKEGYRKEDTKLAAVNFDELRDRSMDFENSSLYEYFNNPFLFIIFQQPSPNSSLSDNKFMGFKRIHFPEKFIYTSVKKTWDDVRTLIFDDLLEDVKATHKDGSYKYNETGIVKSAPNFPKSKSHDVFIRGSGADSKSKNLDVNGIKMYRQNFWIKGTIINEMLNSNDYI